MKKTLLVVIAATMTVAVGVASHAKTMAAHSPLAGKTCQNTQLAVALQSSSGAAGTITAIYKLTNHSGTACSLYGYPGVLLLSKDFTSLPTTVQRGAGHNVGSIPKQTVQLAPNGNAYFAMGYSDVQVGSKPCQAKAPYLMVFAPNNKLPIVGYAGPNGGSNYSCTGAITVSPVTSTPRSR
jgi:hypothetical protein